MKKQIKIAYFPSSATKATVLGSNGRSLDNYCIKIETDEDRPTGNYILDATFLIEDDLISLLQEEVILKVLLDYGYEIFRISKVTASTRYIDIVARQITIADSLTLWLEDVRPTNQTGPNAANYLIANATGTKEIQVISDIQTTSTAYYMRMSLYKALHDGDNCFQNRWGGEVLRRGYTEYINNHVGTDRGFTIREGKNLTGFEVSSNIDTLVTRARGQGFDGILGSYIDSPLINSYNRVYTDVIKYDDVKVKDENNDEGYDTLAEAQAELDRRIREEYSKNGIDKIKASYTINFVQLEKTEEYKDYVVAEKALLGDTIRVYIPKLNTDIKVRAIAKKYDVLAQRTIEIKLSNYIEAKPLSLKQIINRLDSIDSKESILQQAKDNATLMIKSGLKNSYVIVRENEIIIGDTKDINTMVKVWRWNNGGLGFSGTGYYGTYGTAITADGKIVADFITTGVLNANLVKTGTLTSKDGSVSINLDSGAFKIGGNGKVAEHRPEYSKWLHSDGTYSQAGADGFKRVMSGEDNPYHHVTLIVDVSITLTGNVMGDDKIVTLPSYFRGKKFNASAVLTYFSAPAGYIATTPYLSVVSIDQANATVKVHGNLYVKKYESLLAMVESPGGVKDSYWIAETSFDYWSKGEIRAQLIVTL